MKNSIQKSLLAIMLLFGAINIQCSSATQSGGAPAKGAETAKSAAPAQQEEFITITIPADIADQWFSAMEEQSIPKIEIIIQTNPHIINLESKDGWTALDWAIYQESPEVVQFLIDHKANIEKVSVEHILTYYQNTTPLYKAIYEQNIEIVDMLLKAGANIERMVKGETALQTALKFADIPVEMVDLLLKHGSKTDFIHSDKSTAQEEIKRIKKAKLTYKLRQSIEKSLTKLMAPERIGDIIATTSLIIGEEKTNELREILLSTPPQGIDLNDKATIAKLAEIISNLIDRNDKNISYRYFARRNLDARLEKALNMSKQNMSYDITFNKNVIKKIEYKLDGTYFNRLVKLIGVNIAAKLFSLNMKKVDYKEFFCESLTALVEQSGTTKKIIFIEGEKFEAQCVNGTHYIKIDKEEYEKNPDTHHACILHEIGHVVNDSAMNLSRLQNMLSLRAERIIQSDSSADQKLQELLIISFIELAVKKADEYKADTFMLKTATIKQLEHERDFYIEYIKAYCATGNLSEEKLKMLEAGDQEFFYNILDVHQMPTFRIQRVQKRIEELQAEEQAIAEAQAAEEAQEALKLEQAATIEKLQQEKIAMQEEHQRVLAAMQLQQEKIKKLEDTIKNIEQGAGLGDLD